MPTKTKKKDAIEIKPVQSEGAVIAGTTPTQAPGAEIEDIDSLLLGSGTASVEKGAKTSATPIAKVSALYVKSFLEGSKAEKDGKAKKERYADLIRTAANKERIRVSREKNEFISGVKVVADAPLEVPKLLPDGSTEHGPDGKPVLVKEEVQGSISCSVSSDYCNICPDASTTAAAMIAKFKAVLDKEYDRYISAERTFSARQELLTDKVKLAKVIEVLKAANLLDQFEISYAFTPTVAFHQEATLKPEVENLMNLLIGQKLVKPKAASLSGK